MWLKVGYNRWNLDQVSVFAVLPNGGGEYGILAVGPDESVPEYNSGGLFKWPDNTTVYADQPTAAAALDGLLANLNDTTGAS